MTDVATARRVLALSADDDGLSAEDRRFLQTDCGLTEKQVTSLVVALADRFVSPEERANLSDPRLFPRAFVVALAGRDGTEPLRRRVEHLLARSCDERLDTLARIGILNELRGLIHGGGESPIRERCIRSLAPRILDVMASLFRGSNDLAVCQESLQVLSTMANGAGRSYLTRGQTLRAIDLLVEAHSDPDPGVRSSAVITAAAFYHSNPHDLPEASGHALEAWKGRCRPPLEGVLRAGLADADRNVRELAYQMLSSIVFPTE